MGGCFADGEENCKSGPKTVDIPANRRLIIDLPPEVPVSLTGILHTEMSFEEIREERLAKHLLES